MSITAETAKEHANDPAIFDELVDSEKAPPYS